jgi:hypothetical protein
MRNLVDDDDVSQLCLLTAIALDELKLIPFLASTVMRAKVRKFQRHADSDEGLAVSLGATTSHKVNSHLWIASHHSGHRLPRWLEESSLGISTSSRLVE